MSLSHNSGGAPGEAKRNVLVVDDEPTLRLGFSYALSSRQTLVDTASTGRQALEKIKANRYDIVILDLRMPDIDGIGVIETLRLAGNLTPIVLCSAAITPSAALRAIYHRVPDFLMKPVRPVDLREIVEFVLNPPDTTISRAMIAARAGKIEEAIQCIKPESLHDRNAAAWLEVMESLIIPRDDDGPPASEKILRATLATLAFRSGRTS
jgi:DNA-binding response OmpR family regulator